jgi:hypothetical protein
MIRGREFLAALLVLGAVGLAGAGAQESEPVDLELVLAVDVSLSMDVEEQKLQREGYVAALRHRDVTAAIRSGLHGKIALTYVEWAGEQAFRVLVPWTLIDGPESAARFADRLAEEPLLHARRTSISGAIRHASGLFAGNGFTGLKRVIDISGDGPNNQGGSVTEARDMAVNRGIVINGLPVILKKGGQAGFFDLADLDTYYQDCVIGGAGAFTIPVRELAEFIPAVRRKLVLEIAGALPPGPRLHLAQLTGPAPRIDCSIGERMWEEWIDQRGIFFQ